MSSVRLTNAIRDSLLKSLLTRAFSDRADDLLKRSAAFALKVRVDVYGDDLKKMEALPKGWLPKLSKLQVQFGSDYTNVTFGGGLGHYSWPSELVEVGARPNYDVELICTFQARSNVMKVYDARDPICLERQALLDERDDLVKKIQEARSAARAAMNSVSTVQKLIEVWPEVEELAKVYLVKGEQKALLPDIPRSKLNALLDLPPEEKPACS